jgi:hypothetical protein
MNIVPVSKTLSTLILLWISLLPGAQAGNAEGECARRISYPITRNVQDEPKLIAAVERVFSDALIQELEIEHIRAVNRYDDNSSKTWRQFSPTWVLNSPSTLERVLEHFDPSDESSSPGYSGTIHDWLATWEQGYERNFGTIAKSWKDRGRKKFLQTLLVEGAVRYARRMGMGNNPEFFVTHPHETAPYVNELNAGILRVFDGNMDRFQAEFDRVYRQRSGGSVATAAAQVPRIENQARQDLRKLGVDLTKLRTWQPRVAAAARTRKAELDVQLVVESIEAFGSTALPLGGLLKECTDGGLDNEQTQFSWQPLAEVVQRHGGVPALFRKVNAALQEKGLAPVQPQQGTKTLSEEIVVQGALLAAMAVGKTTQATFPGFQALEKTQAMYLEMDSELIRLSGLTLVEINKLVKRRLPL